MVRTAPDAGVDFASEPPKIGYLLRQAAAAHRLKMDRALASLEITPPQFLVLTMLQQHPGCSNADLARMTAVSTPTMTVIVTNLKRREAVASRPHPVHGRIQHLNLTPLGTRLLADARQRAAVVDADLMAGATAEEMRTIAAWLRAAAMAGDGPP